MSFINIATNVSLVAVLSVGGVLLARKELTPGGLSRFALQSAFVGLGFAQLSTAYSDFKKSLDAADRVFEQIEKNKENNISYSVRVSEKSSSSSSADTETNNSNSSSSSSSSGSGSIQLKHVHFTYRSRPDVQVDHNTFLPPHAHSNAFWFVLNH